jgi:hypothetical protein
MGTGPALPGPGRDEDPSGAPAGSDDFPAVGSDRWRLLPSSADWPDWTQDEAYLGALAEEDEPGDLDEEEDPDNAPPPGLDDAQLAELIAEAREVTADQARADAMAARLGETAAMAAVAAGIGRRGPGMPGSAQSFPGVSEPVGGVRQRQAARYRARMRRSWCPCRKPHPCSSCRMLVLVKHSTRQTGSWRPD